ncbi:MAG: AraC family transcriptional regulator [Flavobacteriales bacterium]|nr:MAG: AraC family transcriptional regulator [Flavobacteriales bacterium]
MDLFQTCSLGSQNRTSKFCILSSIINQYKNQNFNDYINGLRIDYIIDKLQNDHKYLNYKISYLAEECGFSSHSLFSSAFKKKLKMSPSSFIEFLKNEQSKG